MLYNFLKAFCFGEVVGAGGNCSGQATRLPGGLKYWDKPYTIKTVMLAS